MREVDYGEVRVTRHRDGDDLLSGGLGLRGLAEAPLPFLDPTSPTAAELRKRAIHTSWRGVADLGPLGGYGDIYGGAPDIPGREYQAFAKLPGATSPHRVLLQLPYNFDQLKRCLVVAASSGSRGIYGAIALAGAWGLPRGCAVAYTDKGAGAGYFDYADDSGVGLDGRRAPRGSVPLEFQPPPAPQSAGIAVKHAHSGDHPEADWGRHVIQAAQFGLAMLDRAFPDEAPFTAQNTKIIATGLSNGGAAVLQAAGLERMVFSGQDFFAGVVALEPNVYVRDRGRPMYDYATEAAVWLPCALLSSKFATTPFARNDDHLPPPAWPRRCARLRAQGKLTGATTTEQAERAYEYLRQRGWTDDAMVAAASTTGLDLWRTIAVGYASSYLRRGAMDMPRGIRYTALDKDGRPSVSDIATRAAWWADSSGIPPDNGIALSGGASASVDPHVETLEYLRKLWTGDDPEARVLQAWVAETAVRVPRRGLPLGVVHGVSDGLVPLAFSSEPYVAWLREQERQPVFWKVPHAQHFDAFLSLPRFGERYVPLLPYGYAALDRLWSHLYEGETWPSEVDSPETRPRGTGRLQREALGLP